MKRVQGVVSNGTPDFKLSAYLVFVIVVDESSIR